MGEAREGAEKIEADIKLKSLRFCSSQLLVILSFLLYFVDVLQVRRIENTKVLMMILGELVHRVNRWRGRVGIFHLLVL